MLRYFNNNLRRSKIFVTVILVFCFIYAILYWNVFSWEDSVQEEVKLLKSKASQLAQLQNQQHRGLSPSKSVCKCDNGKRVLSCSLDDANNNGRPLKLVTYSYYASNSDYSDIADEINYMNGILENLKWIPVFYPAWKMRLYTPINGYFHDRICNSLCGNHDFQICDVNNLPELGNLSKLNGMLWRFFALADKNVEVFLSRDIDSVPSTREVSAVTQWLKSTDKAYHAMRDYPDHNFPILGGMWGAKNFMLTTDEKLQLINIFRENGAIHSHGHDQNILTQHIYPIIKSRLMVHDSFFCNVYNDSIPFPTRRTSTSEWVGNFYYRSIDISTTCPINCRPEYGKDWEYC